MSDKTLNLQEASKLLKMDRATLRKWLEKGKINLSYVRTARKYYIKESDVWVLLESNTYTPEKRNSLEIG